MVESEDQRESLIEETLRLRVLCRNRMVQLAYTWN
jgi:hypothetical protein